MCPEKGDVNSSAEMHPRGLNPSFKTPLGVREHIMNNWNVGYNYLDCYKTIQCIVNTLVSTLPMHFIW